MPYKLAFYRALFERVERLRRGGCRVLVLGDFNTAHREIDLARPRTNRETSGFLPEERAEFDRWIAAGWVDMLPALRARPRSLHAGGASASAPATRNIGWRIDYVLASPAAMRFVRTRSCVAACSARTTVRSGWTWTTRCADSPAPVESYRVSSPVSTQRRALS